MRDALSCEKLFKGCQASTTTTRLVLQLLPETWLHPETGLPFYITDETLLAKSSVICIEVYPDGPRVDQWVVTAVEPQTHQLQQSVRALGVAVTERAWLHELTHFCQVLVKRSCRVVLR